MKLIYVIFRKDLKRFWWEALVALGALILLSRDDINRYDFVPGPMEGLLNFLLPLVWGYLVAALIHEEALVGNRQFWVTRPYPWPALLAAKLLSIVAFVHVPVFLADAFILLNHSFLPSNYIPQLLWKQLVLAAWVTLPSIALASVTRNIAQFFLAAIAIVTVGYLWVSVSEGFSAPWNRIDTKRAAISLGAAGVVAAGLVCLQYSRRRTNLSRAGLGFAVLTAGGLYDCTPRQTLISAQCRQEPGQQGVLSLRIDASVHFPPVPRSRFPAIEFRIPVRLSGLAVDEQLRFEQLTLALTNNRGQRLEFNKLPRLVGIGADSFLAQLWFDRRDTGMQQVFIGRNLYPRLQSLSATLEGTVAANKYREVEVAKTPVDFETRTVPGVGHCSSSVVLNSSGTGDLLRAFCESPNPIPIPTPVRLQSPLRQAPWIQFLGDSAPGGVFSWNTWLSPLNRRQTFFQIVEQRNDGPGSAWVVPREALQNATLHFSLHQPAGCEIVSYRLENVSLQRP